MRPRPRATIARSVEPPPEIRLSPIGRRAIGREAAASADGKETGGILLGFDPDAERPAVITVASGPGPNAVRSRYRFRRDVDYAQEVADQAYGLDRSVWIGEWHTHPMGGDQPSRVDLSSYWQVLDTGVMPVLVAIIVVPGMNGSLDRPRLHAWLIEERTVQRALLVD
jgi:integrative and conjugative element protein (TIGR02256 family)